MRPFGTLCTLVMLWLSALGAGATQRALPGAAQGAAEQTLRGVAESPQLMARGAVAPSSVQRMSADRHGSPGIAYLPLSVAPPRAPTSTIVRVALTNQAGAYAGRPRWRPYDAAAPPSSPSRRP